MEKTLGQIIGTVVDNFSVTNSRGQSTTIRVKYDFSSCSDNDIKAWLCGNRRIVFQRPLWTGERLTLAVLDGQKPIL